jgi:hypothetical protein
MEKNCSLWTTMNKLLRKDDDSNALLSMTPNEINNYFASVSRKTPSQQSVQQISAIPPDNSTDLFVFSPINPETLLQAWKKMKKKGNLTLDPLGMNNLMFDYCLKSDSFLARLVSIFNSCIQNKYFPDFLKTAKVVPIPKVANSKSPAELRPISIQPVVAKLFEECLFFQHSRYLEMNQIIFPTQYGFRSKHSTFHALINITDFIYECLDKNEVCMLVTLDIRKAFDRVDHEVIFRKLHAYNKDPTFFMSYLSNRSHFVSMTHNNIPIESHKADTELQGSCLSNLLFLLVMNDLYKCLEHSKNVFFVDDITLLVSGKLDDLHKTTHNLESDIFRVSHFMHSSIFELNDHKSMIMFIAKPHNLQHLMMILRLI